MPFINSLARRLTQAQEIRIRVYTYEILPHPCSKEPWQTQPSLHCCGRTVWQWRTGPPLPAGVATGHPVRCVREPPPHNWCPRSHRGESGRKEEMKSRALVRVGVVS